MSLRERVLLAVTVLAGAFLVGGAVWSTTASFIEEDALLVLCASALVVELLFASTALTVALVARAPLHQTLGLRRGGLSRRDLVVLVSGTLAASHALDGALELSGQAEESVLFELPRMLEGARGFRLAAALLAIGVAPGIAEELFCRGLIQRGLTRRYGPWVGIPVASVIFGALHVEPIHAAFAAILGLYLGLVAHWAGSIRAAMACHIVNNLAAVTVAASGIGDVGAGGASPVSVALAGSLAIGCAWTVGRKHRNRATARPGTSPESGIPPGSL
jgi:membrane protease YdiL (CAAX protease family)